MKTFICKIKFGLQETTETKTFRFKTKEELNAFYLGLDAAIGYMEYEEIEEETNKLNDLGFKKEVMSDGITAFTLDSKTFR
jgi:hypothetical protein